jgi:hypothetical protein
MTTNETRELNEKQGMVAKKFVGMIEKLLKDVTNDHMLLEPYEHARALKLSKKIK